MFFYHGEYKLNFAIYMRRIGKSSLSRKGIREKYGLAQIDSKRIFPLCRLLFIRTLDLHPLMYFRRFNTLFNSSFQLVKFRGMRKLLLTHCNTYLVCFFILFVIMLFQEISKMYYENLPYIYIYFITIVLTGICRDTLFHTAAILKVIVPSKHPSLTFEMPHVFYCCCINDANNSPLLNIL